MHSKRNVAWLVAALLVGLGTPEDAPALAACDAGSEYRYAFRNFCAEPVWVGLNGTATPGDFQPVGAHYAASTFCTSNADCRANGLTSGVCDGDSGQCLCTQDSQCGGAACLPNGKCSTWVDFCLPKTYTSGSFFPRTGCTPGSQNGLQTLSCETGACRSGGVPLLDCLQAAGGASPENPVTQFEITSTTTSINYDVSLAAGYNVETYAAPVGGGNTEPLVPASQVFQCPGSGCTGDLNQTCPAKLRVPGRTRAVAGCLDPCTACQRGSTSLSCGTAASPASSTDCNGNPFQATHKDLYCAFGPENVNAGASGATAAMASANQGTPTAFGQLDCKPPRVFVRPTFAGYVLPPGQGVCLHPQQPNDYAWTDGSGVARQCGGPGGVADGLPCGGYDSTNATYPSALGYTCRTPNAPVLGQTPHLCMPPVAQGAGTCTTPTGGTTTKLFSSGAGVLNADWLAVGLVAGDGATPYYETFKQSCPGAYAWQYDDASAGFSCATNLQANSPPGTRGEPFTGMLVSFCGSRNPSGLDDLPSGSVVALHAAGQARKKPSRRGQGVVQIRGSFVAPKAISLDRATLRLVNVLDESGGAGELVRGPGGSASLPLVLHPLPGATANGAIYQSPRGARPFARVQLVSEGVGSDRATVRVSIDVTSTVLGRPSRCSPRRKGGTTLETSFAVEVDSARSIFVGANLPWQCRQGHLQRTR